jgi:magnesium transporter
VTVRCVVYGREGVESYDHDDLDAARAAPGTTWVRATDPDERALDALAAAFGIHELELEDVRNGVRPKVELFDDHAFLLVKSARLRAGETTFREEIRDVPVGLFLGSDWVVTVTTEAVSPVEVVWSAVERSEPRLLERGSDFTVYRVLDRLVDAYFDIVDEIEADIERVEDGIVESPDPTTLETINSLRRELLSVRRMLWPTRDAVASLARGDPEQVRDPTEKYFRDVYEHLVQLVDLVETYRDLVAGARDIYLNALSQSTNEVMKRLTVVATIILPLTFVAGVFGMNFGGGPFNMPELGWRFGYPAVVLGMAGMAALLVVYFREEGWL